MFFSLPESLQFLAVRKRRLDQLGRWLKQLNPALRVDASTQYFTNETSREGAPLIHLFREGRAAVTLLLWVVNFMNILLLYTLANWLPTIVTGMGYDTNTGVLIGTLLQVGGTIGTFGLAWLIAKRGFLPMLTLSFLVATISIAFVGQPGVSLVVLALLVFVAGWCVVGGQPGLNALSASYYPTYLRATGVGWGLGIGRVGAIVGPYVTGVLLAQEWGWQQLFWAAAVPAGIAMVAMIALAATLRAKGQVPVQGTAASAPLAH
jgi:AAHS family 4-hydroxybenzoate transporter-like MFS transporter